MHIASYSDSAHISISAPFVKVSTDYNPLGGGIDAGPCQGKGATGDEGPAHDPSSGELQSIETEGEIL